MTPRPATALLAAILGLAPLSARAQPIRVSIETPLAAAIKAASTPSFTSAPDLARARLPPSVPAIPAAPTALLPALIEPIKAIGPDQESPPDSLDSHPVSVVQALEQAASRAEESPDEIGRVFDFAAKPPAEDGLATGMDAIEERLADIVRRHGVPAYPNGYSRPPAVYRGQASRSFGLPGLFKFISGDPRFQIESWDYKHALKKNLALMPSQAAILQTQREVADGIEKMIQNAGAVRYVDSQYVRTFVGPGDKRASAIPTAAKIEGTHLYVMQQYRDAVAADPNAIPLIYEIRERAPRGLPFVYKPQNAADYVASEEYFMLSHVPIRHVGGVHVGLPRKDKGVYWIYLKFAGRNPDGSVDSIALYDVGEAPPSGPVTKEIGFAKKGAYRVDGMFLRRNAGLPGLEPFLRELSAWTGVAPTRRSS